MANIEELRKRFEDNFISHPHENDDGGTCASLYTLCTKCIQVSYYLTLDKCKCKAPRTQSPCNCGSDQIKEEQFAWFLSEIEAAEKAKVEEILDELEGEWAMSIAYANSPTVDADEADQADFEAKFLRQHIDVLRSKFLNPPE